MILRNPDFGNSYTVSPNVVIKTSLDGDLRISKNNAPIVERQVATFSGLSSADKDSLQSFLIGNAGCTFVWKNHLDQSLTCVVIDTIISFTRTGQGCMWTTTLSFEVL